MSKRIITIPDLVRQKVAALGEEGSRWLAGLGDLIDELEQEWQVSVVGASLAGGSEAYIAQVSTNDGSQAILKVAIPESPGNTMLAHEITALTLANGHGYARLLRSDLSRRALLLEPLGTALKNLGYATKDQIALLCTTLQESWVRVPSASSLPIGTDAARWHAQFSSDLWEKLARPCSPRALDTALAFAEDRASAFDPQRAVLVHGDAHNGNALLNLSQTSQTSQTSQIPQHSLAQPSFKLIDPDGIVAEAACDLGVLMREWLDELLADPVSAGRERCAYLSDLTGVDRQAIWQWGFMQCMSTGLFLLHLGQEQAGSQMLKVAEAWSSRAIMKYSFHHQESPQM